MKRVKQVYKISKKCYKKSCHLVPKVVIGLPFEGRNVEGSRKYGGRERVPKVGSRREETITEPINSRIGEFHIQAHITPQGQRKLGQNPTVANVSEPLW